MRIVVAEDNLLTREGIVGLLTRAGHDVIAAVANAERLLAVTSAEHPDVAVIDVRMPPTHTTEGIDAARRILADHPGVGVLVLSQYIEPGYALSLLEERPDAVGYLLKERVSDPVILTDALDRIVDGESVIDPTIVKVLMRRQRSTPLDELSDREREVLALVAEGLTNRAIAARLVLAERTIESHITRILIKLGVSDGPDIHRRVVAALAFVEGSRPG